MNKSFGSLFGRQLAKVIVFGSDQKAHIGNVFGVVKIVAETFLC